MRTPSILLLLLSVPAALSSQSALIAADLSVPGENTLTYCNDPKASDYIFDIEYVNLSPNPPVPGENLTIHAAGTSSQTIEEGAKIFLQVKLGYITLLRQEMDFCDAIDNVDLECPLEKGYRTISKEVAIPGAIPKGTYSVSADAYTGGVKKEITCLKGEITFV